jgi:spore cortex formation protein SpoVR/YcgB (stage V sporulation)
MIKPVFDTTTDEGNIWTEERMFKVWGHIEKIAKGYGLDYYDCDLVKVGPYELIDVLSKHGLPEYPTHWQQGMTRNAQYNRFKAGKEGLPYEIVINTDPIQLYVMDTNTMAMQTLVLAHAGPGHGSFFTNNYLFKQNTDAEFIRPYLRWAREFIEQCEYKYGVEEVEAIQDACIMLSYQSVFRGDKTEFSVEREIALQKERKFKHETEFKDYTHRNLEEDSGNILHEECENLLYFFEKQSTIATWKKEICRIYRIIAQYFYPQIRTKTMNEGWATFWHMQIMKDLYDEGHVDIGTLMQTAHSQDGVLCHCHSMEKQGLMPGLNPYAIGYKTFNALRDICTNPTAEDKAKYPDIAGTDWVESLKYIAYNYKDSEFLLQWLPDSVIKDMKLWVASVGECTNDMLGLWGDEWKTMHMDATHSDSDLDELRLKLADHYEYDNMCPPISVSKFNPSQHEIEIKFNGFKGQKINIKGKILTALETLWKGHITWDT